MDPQKISRSAWLALLITAIFLMSWEGYWRYKGFKPTFNDDKALWANARKKVYNHNSTVFIGSSRIKFDLDIPEWEKQTGENAVQLSLVGTSPLLLLHDLANDPDFKGKLVVDITEELFFSQNPAFHKSASEATSFYHKQTPSEKFSGYINFAIENNFTFLEERKFSLSTLLNDMELENRPGVFAFPSFPKDFELTTYDRQTYMSDRFLKNPEHIKTQTGIWEKLILSDKTPPVSGKALSGVLHEIKTSVDKIKKRGGRVIFIRTPSSGPMFEAENKGFPRQLYWNRLLDLTQTQGIHFRDDAETKNLVCPEWSHLSPADAVRYTQHLVKRLLHARWFQTRIS